VVCRAQDMDRMMDGVTGGVNDLLSGIMSGVCEILCTTTGSAVADIVCGEGSCNNN
jgi:hypothetical protein